MWNSNCSLKNYCGTKKRIHADFESAEKAVQSSLQVKKPKSGGNIQMSFTFFPITLFRGF
jgi:hypothetical protein